MLTKLLTSGYYRVLIIAVIIICAHTAFSGLPASCLPEDTLMLPNTSPSPDTLIHNRDSLMAPDSLKQKPDILISSDSLTYKSDTSSARIDSLHLAAFFMGNDSLQADTLSISNDTIITEKVFLESSVDYHALDSLMLDVKDKKVFLYKDAELNYEKSNLKANYIEVDFDTQQIYATYTRDSLGREEGVPLFDDKGQSFSSKEMTYNFDSEKGLIKNVITQQGEGYLHGSLVKKLPNDITNIASGDYTTCDLEHPHFKLHFNKAKMIPDKKIVTGPAYLIIEDVPIPIMLPFGLFPIFKGRTNGVIIPSYGESSNRGFYFENGGYYLGINDYLDLTILGDIYTRGSWALKPKLSYKKRYRYSGSLNFSYAVNKVGDEGTPEFSEKKDFSIRWSHTQDPKARPNQNFSASVNIVSSDYNRYNPVSSTDYLSNTFQSSISYQRNFANKYHLSANLKHSQNTITRQVDLSLPTVSFSVDRFYPFRKKNAVGKTKWYENISVNYSMNADNRISTLDTLLFKDDFMQQFNSGIKHYIPISSSVKVLKYFNLSNNIRYNERWYFQYYDKYWTNDTLIADGDTTVGYITADTIHKFKTARDFSYTASLNTKLYGILQFKRGPVRAIRHVMTPSVSFTYRPDFAEEKWGYYKYYYTDAEQSDSTRYSIFQGNIYGSPPSGKSGNVGFSLTNNLEMKVKSKKDTITGMKKIVLIENFTLSTSYNLALDSMNWSPLSLSGRTTLFKNLNVQYNGSFDMYAQDSIGTRINQFEFDKSGRLLRFDNSTWNFSLNYSLSSDKGKNKKSSPATHTRKEGMPGEMDEIMEDPDRFLDWDNPWRFNIAYSLRFTNRYDWQRDAVNRETIQTLSVNGNVNITPKWKIGFRTNYDFENGEFSYTSLNFYRDLHCWEMRFNWIPIGGLQSWNFTINVKSPLLQDLKLRKKKDFRDY